MSIPALTSSEVVVVDHDVRDKDQLLQSLRPGTRVVELDPLSNGIEQIACALAGASPVCALHIVGHGVAGGMVLGNARLDATNVEAHCANLQAIAAALSPGADLLLYGCEVARTSEGKAFVDAIARMTHANVAASETITGADALGGDWNLQYRCGPVTTAVFVPPEVRATYPHAFPAPHPFSITSLNGDDGFKLTGTAQYDYAGWSVAELGDVDGDGFDDFTVGAFRASPNGLVESGATYVVFGTSEGFDASIPLSSLDGSNGFRISGVTTGDRSGSSVSGGDINGDGLADIIIGARLADANGINSGAAYVVFGKASAFGATIDLTSLNGNDGFAIPGGVTLQYAGGILSSAGDVNGDGFDDFIIAGPYGATSQRAYVVFGDDGGFPASFDLNDLDGTNGFQVELGNGDQLSSVAGAGDINGDGYDDIGFGSGLSGLNGTTSGAAYVLFGRSAGFAQTIDATALSFGEGFRLVGEASYDQLGFDVGAAGDVNGDGVDDLIVGAPFADANGSNAGAVYLVYGRTTGFADTITIVGSGANDHAGSAVASAGDVNGDGFDDLLIDAQSGTYVVFGSIGGGTSDLSPSNIDGWNAFRVVASANSVSSAGDIDGDGYSDILLGVTGDGAIAPFSGAAYVIYGDDFTQSVDRFGTDEDDTLPGTTDDDAYLAGAGNDTILTGGGADVVYAGSGNDVVHIAGADFKRIDGGPGTDTIALAGAGIVFDLRTVANNRIADVEIIDLTGTGNNTLVLDTLDLYALNEGVRLRIDGDPGDRVLHHVFWTPGTELTNGDQTYQVYTRGPMTIEVDTDVTLRFAGGRIHEVDGDVGFSLLGETERDETGYAVSGVGDVNGDGFDDFVIGAPGANQNGSDAGGAYVVLGKASGVDAQVLLSGLDGSDGFRLLGAETMDQAGWSVAGAGDVNGDGFDDLLIGATGLNPSGPIGGGAHVVFGKASAFAASVDLGDLDGGDGFRVLGQQTNELAGASVAGAGDVNGDGYDDFVIGAPRVNDGGTSTGKAYVVFGGTAIPASTNLGSLDGGSGFSLDGEAERSYTGQSVAGAGDINGDGFADIIVGAPGIDANGTDSGVAYVVYGSSTPFAASIALDTLDGTNGFRLVGAADYDRAGRSVAGAGDVNGDGFDDLIVGAYSAAQSKGVTYVVFGQSGPFGASVSLGSLSGSNGFALVGTSLSGYSVAAAGDVNGDGYDDILVGEPRSNASTGMAYAVYGKADGFAATIDLTALSGTDGFRLVGTAGGDELGRSVAAAGDLNGDGFDDILVGARSGDGEVLDSGRAFVVFGGNFTDGVAYAGTSGDDTLTGTEASERFLGGLGNDVLTGVGGDDFMEGGHGDDILFFDASDSISGGPGIDRAVALGTDGVTLVVPDIEWLWVTNAADVANASAQTTTVTVFGMGGNDSITGGSGNDQLYGQGGADQLFGGDGDDWLYIDSQDILSGIVQGGNGSDRAASLDGSALALNLGTSSIEWVWASNHDDVLEGTAQINDLYLYAFDGTDTLRGGSGNDNLYGMAGADYLRGGVGNDVLYFDSDDVEVLGGDGYDTAQVLDYTGVGVSLILGASQIEAVYASNQDDTLDASTATWAVYMNGYNGDDVMSGGSGDDNIYGGGGADTISGGGGNDFLDAGGGSEVDTLVVSGTQAQYILHYAGGVLTSVQDTVGGRDGWDNVVGFEQIQYTNGIFAV